MYKLVNGKLTLTVYSKQDMEMYINSGWKLEENKEKKKNKKEVINEDRIIKTESNESIQEDTTLGEEY